MLTSIEQTPAQLQAQRAAGAGAPVDLAERLRAVELVAVDLDGTLLNANKDVMPRTAAAIAAALEVGVHVVPATGRVRSVLPPGVLGVPLMYAVTLPLVKLFITACLGAGLGGVIAALFHVGTVSQGVSGLFGLLIVVPGQQLVYVLAMLAAYAGGFVLTWFFGVDEQKINEFYGE